LKVLLVEPRPRKVLGGLMTIGWLNSLDLNKSPVINSKFPEKTLNGGLYDEWYRMIEGTSFDVNRAAMAFQKMVQDEKNIDVLMNVKQLTPVLEGSKVTGMTMVKENGEQLTVQTGAIIDATQDADIAAAAGAPFTLLREDLGVSPDVRVAVTLVFKIGGVTDKVWQEMRQYPGVGSDSRSIWGYGDAREYQSSNPDRVRIRSLNIGRQDDNTILLNTMQIYGIDPLDPASLAEGIRIGTKEAPLIVDFLKKKYKPFRDVTYAGVASELYVRESRHIIGEYRLTIADLIENRDFPDAIAYGSYEVDIQGSSTSEGTVMLGSIFMNPEQYGVPFRSLVPQKIDGLLVVGRSASFDTLPHGSARVIPLGMATGEAAGAAVKLAKDKNKTFRELSSSNADMTELRNRLTKQGMDLRMRPIPQPSYMKHKDYEGLLAAISLYATVGGYHNDKWALDEASYPERFINVFRKVQKKYPEQFQSKQNVASLLNSADETTLKWEDVAYLLTQVAGASVARAQASDWLVDQGWIDKQTIQGFTDPNKLTNGDTFMVVRDLVKNVTGVKSL
jgi:hypothetical protein